MILGFKEQFKSKILDGSKIHTIREDPKDRWKSWREIDFATGVRTKNYTCFKKGKVSSVQLVYIWLSIENEIVIQIGYSVLLKHQMEELIKNDGFVSYIDFFQWFYPLIQKSHDKTFRGKLIHWTDKRY